jgi:fucose permease
LLNLLHACFGIGAILGPIVLSLAPAGDFRPAFLVSGAFAIVTAPLILAGPAPTAPQPATDEPVPRALRRRLAVFVALFVLYVGVETGIGGWAPTHLAATGRTVADAARWTAGFWAAFTAGRLLGAGLTVRVRSDRLVIGGLACGAVCLLAATRPGIAGMAYIAAGLALAPVFPTGVAWLSTALPGVRGGTATVLGGALLGGVTVPPLIGQVVNVAGPDVVPWLLAGVALVATAVGLIVAADARGAMRATADVTTTQD